MDGGINLLDIRVGSVGINIILGATDLLDANVGAVVGALGGVGTIISLDIAEFGGTGIIALGRVGAVDSLDVDEVVDISALGEVGSPDLLDVVGISSSLEADGNIYKMDDVVVSSEEAVGHIFLLQ